MSGTILTDDFFNAFESSLGDVTEAETLPPHCYTSEEFFKFEKEALFSREWLCVGREDWVKNPGDYFTASHVGEPLIISRTRDGELKALSAVCQHRA
ncbi:MAG: Rieske 2Fe-2S domain-containing protein, partial [Parvibaculum sp.]|nr:Rieske 2Fe-2S domain-containing protein [Parvibaculum sp.]